MTFKRLAIALALLLALPVAAFADSATVVSSCGSVTIPAGQNRTIYQDTTGTLCTATGGGGTTTITASKGALTDRSGTITSGGAAQTAVALNASRKYLLCQNMDTVNTETIWISAVGTAAANTAGSIALPANFSVVFEGTFVPTSAISVIAATTGHKFTCWEG